MVVLMLLANVDVFDNYYLLVNIDYEHRMLVVTDHHPHDHYHPHFSHSVYPVYPVYPVHHLSRN
jgi:hypothetical protein